jgi:pimeloyl-ACP methyl ester carboxylesterase
MNVLRLCAFLAALTVFLPGAAQAQSGKENCVGVFTPVSILEGGPKAYSLYGELCHPEGGPSDVLQILVHGYSYDHRYWAPPGFGDGFDYVKSANAAGYSTLAIDRIGSAGESDRPLSALVTLHANAVALHDVIAAARGGAIGGEPYETVITVGHSLGTAISWIEASLYGDVDGLISTGFGHPVGNVQDLLLSTIPALLDPRLRPLVGLDAGYLTTTPGTRDDLFYRVETAGAGLIAYDEETKGVGTISEIATLTLAEIATLSIHAPVLFVMGEHDNIFCFGEALGGFDDCRTDETLYLSERAYFPLVADFETYVQPGSGHNINLHQNAAAWRQRAIDWAVERFPPGEH